MRRIASHEHKRDERSVDTFCVPEFDLSLEIAESSTTESLIPKKYLSKEEPFIPREVNDMTLKNYQRFQPRAASHLFISC